MATIEDKLKAFERLLKIMDELREKCPWDKKQTMESLKHLSIEEVYELAEAIADGELEEVKKELGDLMLHLVFYAKIGEEKNAFDIADVLNTQCEKLIFRHPHIYGNEKVSSEEEVKRNWEKLKLKEKKGEEDASVLSGVPKGLPALIKAIRIQDKARGVGFDWDNKEQVWEKVQEELNELKYEVDHTKDKDKIEDEFGDVLFSIINYARFLDINPEECLERSNRKFINRFKSMEKEIKDEKRSFSDMTLQEMDIYWEKAKKSFRAKM